MDPIIEEKIKQYKKFAQQNTEVPSATYTDTPQRETNLSKVIRSEEDAEMFMAQLNCLIRLAK